MNTIAFIYAKKGKIKALNIDDAKNFKDPEWKHTATIDFCVFIEQVINEFPIGEILQAMKQLQGVECPSCKGSNIEPSRMFKESSKCNDCGCDFANN